MKIRRLEIARRDNYEDKTRKESFTIKDSPGKITMEIRLIHRTFASTARPPRYCVEGKDDCCEVVEDDC